MIEEQNLEVEYKNDDFIEVRHQLDIAEVFDPYVPVLQSLLFRSKEDIDTGHDYVVAKVNQK